MKGYSMARLLRHAVNGHRHWQPAWRKAEPKRSYDAVIVGAGGHGLAAAYYLAGEFGVRSVAVLERGWLGGGNVARNTTIVRSNYFTPERIRLHEFSLKKWEGLTDELNFNLMFSQRGIINLAHTPGQLEAQRARGNAMRVRGVDAVALDREGLRRHVPALDLSGDTRWPVIGGLMQPRAGNARHDAVAWGYARAASALGVDIIENCEVTAIRREGGRIRGLETTRGYIGAGRAGVAVAGDSGRLARMAGFRLPLETHVLQAMVSEPLKPCLDVVVTFGASEFYVSQSNKGELVMGAHLDGYNTFQRRGGLPVIERAVAIFTTMFPQWSRVRLMRSWAGIVDMSMDGSPILGRSPVEGLFLNAGWCYGGFKATPAAGWLLAYSLATGDVHGIAAPFDIDRFAEGRLIDEAAAGPHPHHQH